MPLTYVKNDVIDSLCLAVVQINNGMLFRLCTYDITNKGTTPI